MTSVVSMHPFKGRLYVGSSGWYSTLLPSSELIRINPDDSWQLVVGNTRLTNQGLVFPISGFPDGFLNPFNGHFWRMQDQRGVLLLGTNDYSWGLKGTFLDLFLGSQYGFDLFSSIDGRFWSAETLNGFGNPFDFGARTMASSPTNAYIGSANHALGTDVFRGSTTHDFTNSPVADAPSPLLGAALALIPRAEVAAAQVQGTFPSPGRLEAESKRGAAVLSWDGVPGARYEVFRSTYRPNRQLNVTAPPSAPQLPNDDRRSRVPPGLQLGRLPPDAWIPGPFTSIGTTNNLFYEDSTALDGVRYAYYVQAQGPGGATSVPSNLALVPNQASVVTFDHVVADIEDLVRRGKFRGDHGPHVRNLADAKDKAKRGDGGGARQSVGALRQQIRLHQVGGLDAFDAEDLEAVVGRLERRLALVEAGVLSSNQLETGNPDDDDRGRDNRGPNNRGRGGDIGQ
jgi:hypothetical protein